MPEANTPILVGAFQKTWKVAPEELPTALEMIEIAARGALEDTGAGEATLGALDTVLTVGFTIESPGFEGMGLPKPANPPKALARNLDRKGARAIHTYTGGNTPQMAVNKIAEEIANGDVGVAVLTGAEFLGSYWKLLRGGADMSAWKVDDDAPGEVWGDPRPGHTDIEGAHGMERPTNIYPLVENAIRAERGASVAEHQLSMGKLFAPFTEIAARNPHAWFPIARDAEEIATVSDKNRLVGFPYTKYMNAIIQVDQAAGVVMTSVGKARELGIPEDKWVYLHGCGDASDIWYTSERPAITRSPAIAGCWDRASRMANIGTDELDFIDLYSCFPSAVEIACKEIGLAEDDSRGLTVTGGLPYFGGPGNNYVMHSIATTVEKVRGKPGAFGICTANGWYLTKHSAGIYSTRPVKGTWKREDPSVLQAEIDAQTKVEVAEKPEGVGTVETCTVVYGRDAPMFGIVMGWLEDGRRFIANTATDEATIAQLQADDAIGRPGTVTPTGDGLKNTFVFA